MYICVHIYNTHICTHTIVHADELLPNSVNCLLPNSVNSLQQGYNSYVQQDCLT